MDGFKSSEEAEKEESQNESLTSKLNTILTRQKPFGDKHGIGYDQNASTSKVVASKNLINIVPASHVIPCTADVIDKKRMLAKPFFIRMGRSSEQIPYALVRRTLSQKKIPTCHFFGKRGHIRPYCNQLP
jgi:hypothetical protein